jgi:hypothetical protein
MDGALDCQLSERLGSKRVESNDSHDDTAAVPVRLLAVAAGRQQGCAFDGGESSACALGATMVANAVESDTRIL